jgi:phosphoglucosamine mutase
LLGAEGRIIVRASGTEPLVRIMVETKDPGLAQQYAEQVALAIKG